MKSIRLIELEYRYYAEVVCLTQSTKEPTYSVSHGLHVYNMAHAWLEASITYKTITVQVNLDCGSLESMS